MDAMDAVVEPDMPRGISIEQGRDRLVITRRWFGAAAIVLLLFAAIWGGFLVFWYVGAAESIGSDRLMMMLFPVLHVLVGVGLGYMAVAYLVNRTTLTMTPTRLAIEHGPLPWPGNGDYDPARIEQLYCRQRIRHSKNRQHISYELHAKTLDGQAKKLLTGLPKSEQAQFLEHRLEQAMGITNQPIDGEHHG